MRKYLRQIAKARMKAMGMDRVNRRMNVTGTGPNMRTQLWKRVTVGDMAKEAENKQAEGGRKLRRKLKKVPA